MIVENFSVCDMICVVDLTLPRQCVLDGVAAGSSLGVVTFGASRSNGHFWWQPREVRFESPGAEFSPDLVEGRVCCEVACEMQRETLPFPPP
jgi:hypothetical protein